VFFWFIATACLSVWFVFRDDRFDYRFLILGVFLPDIVDVFTGGSWIMHTLLASVVAMVVIMLATKNKRPLRRRLLAIPIGMFLHLVFDGAFTSTDVFWWPFTGGSFDEPLPVAQRWGLNVVLEIVGLVGIVWLWRRFHWSDPRARNEFLRTGHLREGKIMGVGEC
jgi:hypothetical protein